MSSPQLERIPAHNKEIASNVVFLMPSAGSFSLDLEQSYTSGFFFNRLPVLIVPFECVSAYYIFF